MSRPERPYGFELIMDLHGCDASKFNRKSIEQYMIAVCEAIGMERQQLYFWDCEGVPVEKLHAEPHLVGTSAVQFITTSNIVIHTLDLLASVYINVFSCKEFDRSVAERLTREWFNARDCKAHLVKRT